MAKLPISVFIIALNEADRIGQAIASVRTLSDEVIVIDSGSTDETTAVAIQAGAKVIYNKWSGYGAQKRFGEDQCWNDWLLNIDADEAISPQLAQEIQMLFSPLSPQPESAISLSPEWEKARERGGLPEHSAYWVNIAEILPGQKRVSFFAHKTDAIRLYDKRRGRFDASPVHDSVRMLKGTTTGQLKYVIEHRSSRGLSHSMDKINRYSTMQAEDMLKRGKHIAFPALRLIWELKAGFFKAYILRGYLFQGRPGFVNSLIYAYSRFIRMAKFLELKNK